MSKKHFEDHCSPYDPYSKVLLGWIDPIEVTDSLSDQAITDFMSTDRVYKLWSKPNEYFLVSNHVGTLQASFWEQTFPGQGLLIWHVDPTGDNMLYQHHKKVDVESAHGLYDHLGEPSQSPNDSTGKDTLDVSVEYYGVPTCFFNVSTKTDFNGTTNPSSDAYVYSPGHGFPDDYKQTAATGA
jgi:hypothetical protein